MKTLSLLIVLLLIACSSPEPVKDVTLAVENTTCDTACATIHVLAFPTRTPATPGGPWNFDIGTLSTRYGCFTFPSTKELVPIAATLGAPSQQFIWTVRDSLALGATSALVIGLSPSTTRFVPAAARGWLVKLPSAATPIPSAVCGP